MTRINREQLQKRIVQHYINIANKKRRIKIKHFLQEKIPRQTTYSIINKYENSAYVGDKPRSGRPKKLSRGKLTKLKRLVNKKTSSKIRIISDCHLKNPINTLKNPSFPKKSDDNRL
ncbi:unnamed protein product [Rotaria socialis]|uniref:Uncharacterized protein n=1 Tax=Rotaria socialis TaxID=392032 RepID=A0A821AEC1_9BILA|nr:unnamed protein product [Rotaria socialis]CAF4575864.1 unnamed protein product [Rotaria socialis]